MRFMNRLLLMLCPALVLALAGCGGGGGDSINDAPPPMAPGNASPSVSSVPDQDVDEDAVAGPIELRVDDAETDAAALEVRVSAADPMLLPASGIDLSGDGRNRTLFLVPAAGRTGSTGVTVTVTDSGGASTRRSFTLVVNPLFRAELGSWMRETVLVRDAFDTPVGQPRDDGSPLSDVENIQRIRFSDATADDTAAYDDLLPGAGEG